MVQEIREALSYDDVLLVPKFSNITSRKHVDTSSNLTKNIRINLPIISANMDSVTEANMAIAMARQGGIGIIHRFLTVEDQVNEILKAKRSEGILIEKPYTLTQDHIIKDAKKLMNEKKITGIPIIDGVGRYVGILTNRDLMFEDNLLRSISEVMTPKDKSITAPANTDTETAKILFKQYKVEKLPLVDKSGILKGLITAKDIMKRDMYPLSSKDKKGRVLVGGAIGVKGDYLERAEALINADCDVLCIDIAHGHSQQVIDTIKALRDKFGDVEIIAGNVVTPEATLDLINAGADAIKVGVGPGCFAAGTRILVSNGSYKNIEDVQAGDRVINKYGKPVNVKKSFCTGIRKVSKIRNSIFYQDTYVTSDHRYWVGDLNSTSIETIQSRGYSTLLELQSKTIPKMSKYKWKEIKDLKQDVLLMPREINFELDNFFEIILNKRVGGNWSVGFNYKEDIILTPCYELGYIFGLFLGDGSSHSGFDKKNNSHVGSVRWYLGKHEIEKANKLIECIVKIFDKECSLNYKKNIIQIILYYKPFADFLQTFGKRENKELPTKYLIKNREYLQGILDGLIDSDGHKEESGRIRFTNTSQKLIELFNILNYLLTGVFPNNIKRKPSIGGLKNVKLENVNEIYIGEIINTGEKRLTEEYQVAKLLENKETELYEKVYDLEVDCETHSFIANNAIVHNSICITRIVTGAGFPQFTGVLECAKVGNEVGIPIIADGGIKLSGDITKALAAGASTVMLGNLLGGTEESPGQTIIKNGRKFKIYRGSAGFGSVMARKLKENGSDDLSEVVPEGVEGTTPYRGNVSEVIYPLLGGLRSGMSYCGAHNIQELWKNAEFVKITGAGLKESHSHDIDQIK